MFWHIICPKVSFHIDYFFWWMVDQNRGDIDAAKTMLKREMHEEAEFYKARPEWVKRWNNFIEVYKLFDDQRSRRLDNPL